MTQHAQEKKRNFIDMLCSYIVWIEERAELKRMHAASIWAAFSIFLFITKLVGITEIFIRVVCRICWRQN